MSESLEGWFTAQNRDDAATAAEQWADSEPAIESMTVGYVKHVHHSVWEVEMNVTWRVNEQGNLL